MRDNMNVTKHKLQVNDKNFEQPFSLSNAINKYFCSVSAELASQLTCQIKSPFPFLQAQEKKRLVSALLEWMKLHSYSDDEQLYDSDEDPKLLEKRLMHSGNIANEWFKSNGMLVSPTKHQAMIIGNSDHVFSFPLRKSTDLFGISVDDKLCFDEHIFQAVNHSILAFQTWPIWVVF